MQITWLGHAAFKLKASDGTSVITDPYTPSVVGNPPIRESADLVIISSDDDDGHCRADLIQGNPQVVNALDVARSPDAQCQACGFVIEAIEAEEWEHHPTHEIPGQNGMYKFTVDGIVCGHMGDVGNALSEEQIAFFESVDILLALTGGPPTIDLKDLMVMIDRVQPRVTIPMHFMTLTYRPRNILWLESFLAFFDKKNIDFACSPSMTLDKESLPTAPRVMVLDYVR